MFSLTHTHPSHPTSFFRFAIFFSSTSSTLTDPFERRRFRLASRPRLAAAFHPTSLTDSNQGSDTRYVKNHVVFSLFHAAVPVLFLSCAEDQEDLPGCGDDVVTPTHKASKPPFPVRSANQRTQTGSPWASRLSSGPLFPGTIAIQRSHSPIHDPSTPRPYLPGLLPFFSHILSLHTFFSQLPLLPIPPPHFSSYSSN